MNFKKLFQKLGQKLGLVKPATVDRIVADFQTTIAKLDEHIVAKRTEANDAAIAIIDLQKAKSAAESEAARAASVAARISSIIA